MSGFEVGLVSVTFRHLSPEQIVELVSEAGLKSIEWGGDIHVPHGDTAKAAEVAKLTADSGLKVAAYGSYYRVGNNDGQSFDAVLDSAVALGAPVIRVWAGNRGSVDADEDYREIVANDTNDICERASLAGITVAYEFHGGTLTDTAESAVSLLRRVDHRKLRCLWQPNGPESVEERLAGLKLVLPWLENVHLFHWTAAGRRPLSDGESAWRIYADCIYSAGRKPAMLLEFVRDDSTEQFRADAGTALRWFSN